MTHYIKDHGIKAHLSDHRSLKVLSKEVQDYLQQDWFPTVEKEGLSKIGAVVADDVFAKATVDKVNTVQLGKMTINTFNSSSECENWLSN
jgi:putative lipase involved disintegration of autophagic bodies